MNRINNSAGHIWNFSISPQQPVLLYTCCLFPLKKLSKVWWEPLTCCSCICLTWPLWPDLSLSSFSPSLFLKASFRWRGEQERKEIGGRGETLNCAVVESESEMKANGKCPRKKKCVGKAIPRNKRQIIAAWKASSVKQLRCAFHWHTYFCSCKKMDCKVYIEVVCHTFKESLLLSDTHREI